MAFQLFTLFTLCVFLNIVFSYPTRNEIKSLSTDDSVISPSISVPSENSIVKLYVVDESQMSVVKRTKRNVIGNDNCPQGLRWFLNECITEEKYQVMMGEDKR
uniref:SFRICE_029037 n=1 Tax=Spodoptera frugiperda TaxID=7108 RepID=A0A2H1VZW3_SPOFR